MPQLVPFYFINEVTITFVTVTILIFLFAKYILPKIVHVFTTRVFVGRI